jgi:predicted metal-dependent HD superfamily phosphohydrolase
MNLKQRFHKLVSIYTEDNNLIDFLWNAINTHYSEKHRAYHNLTHITEIFNYFDVYKQRIEHPNIIEFSIFYHDIIYNIWKQDNEEKSAVFALKHLSKLNLPIPFLEQISQQIIATKTHATADNDTKWMVDFDLAILGQPVNVYQKYTQLIREEYKLIPKFIYKKGRKKVLQHFIDKPFIYATNQFKEQYETQARKNLFTELKSL